MKRNGLARLTAVLARRNPIDGLICSKHDYGPCRKLARSPRGQVPKETYLTVQLEESASYLRDAGWLQTAALLLVAAVEIESLRQEVAEVRDASRM